MRRLLSAGPGAGFLAQLPVTTPVALPRPQQLPERNNKNIFVALAQRTSTWYHLSGKRNNKSFFVAFTAPSYGLFVPQCRLHNILHRRYAPARPRQRDSRRRSLATTLQIPSGGVLAAERGRAVVPVPSPRAGA